MRWIKKKILNAVLSHLFDALTEDDLIPLKDLEDGQKREIGTQARAIRDSEVWQRMMTEAKSKAQKKMFEKSVSWDDMFFGKAALWIIDLFDKRLEALSKIKN